MATSHLRTGNAEQQLNRLKQHDLERRRSGASSILGPQAIAGAVSPARVLHTTLNGELRPITQADLAAFRANIAGLSSKLEAGITAKEAIELSRPVDRERANAEIRYAAPTLVRGGLVRFVTDSGPNSKVARHHTAVEFVGWTAAVSRPGTPLQAAAWLCREGKLRVECQCEAFTFWGFRYIASIGNYVLGRKETGYPKIRQPTLAGCACKHLLRTLSTLSQDMLVRRRIADAITAERRLLDQRSQRRTAPTVRFTQADADRISAGTVRRIPVVTRPEQRTDLPVAATKSDIEKALARFEKRKDASGQAIARGLAALIAFQQAAK